MGERTPNLNLYKPNIVPLETGWGDEVNGNFDTIDELLNGAAQSVYLIAGKVNYVANAVYTNGVWNRLNTGMGAVRLALDPSTQTITVYYAAAGANPISWTTLQTFSSDGLDAGAKKITNLATPTAASDAATKAYVDGSIAKVLPYRPETWPTEEIGWGDGSATTVVNNVKIPGTAVIDNVFFTASTPGIYNVSINVVQYILQDFNLYVNSTAIYSNGFQTTGSPAVTKNGLCLNAGDTLRLTGHTGSQFYAQVYATVVNTGKKIGPITINLSGKWLALGLDMKGLAATIKVQGVELPYSDYVKCFPLAPSEISFPGGWDVSLERPVLKRYV